MATASVVWAVAWAVVGACGGLTLAVMDPDLDAHGTHRVSFVTAFAMILGALGAGAGALFAFLLSIAGRRHTVEALDARRVGLLGALAGALAPWLFGSTVPAIILACAVLGFGLAAGSLVLARRAVR